MTLPGSYDAGPATPPVRPSLREVGDWYRAQTGEWSPGRIVALAELVEDEDLDLTRCSIVRTSDQNWLGRSNRTGRGWRLGASDGVRYYLTEKTVEEGTR